MPNVANPARENHSRACSMSSQEIKAIAESRYQENIARLDSNQRAAIEQAPALYRKLFARVLSGATTSKTEVIKLKCLECCAFIRSEVTACPVTTCALWHVRPKA